MLMQFGTFPATGPALNRGIVSGFGIDTICSAGNDLFSEMRLALAAERSRANAAAISSDKMAPAVDLHQRDMLRLATVGGARVWHLESEIGTLTPGKQGPRRRAGRRGNRHRRRRRRQARRQAHRRPRRAGPRAHARQSVAGSFCSVA
jgi:hypothetical protein